MNFLTCSFERLDLVRCGPREASYLDASCELKFYINVIFANYLCDESYTNLLTVESKAISNGDMQDIISTLEEVFWANFAILVRSYVLLGLFATFRHKLHLVLDHFICPNRYLACY